MKTNILLAVDVAPGSPSRHIAGAVEMTRELARGRADRVIVLHIQEFSLPKLATTMRDHGGASGRRVVDDVVAELRNDGIRADGLIREADFGHVADSILAAADQFDARLIVLGSRGATDLPRIPAGSVAAHLLRHARLPVLIAPSGPGRKARQNQPNAPAVPAAALRG